MQYSLPLVDARMNNPFRLGVHNGFDMIRSNSSQTLGSPLLAVCDATVKFSGFGVVMGYDYGNWIEYLSDDGMWWFQAHARNPFTQVEGQRISRGEQLNQVGATGKVTGPHVHTALMPASFDKPKSQDGYAYINARLAPILKETDMPTVYKISSASPHEDLSGIWFLVGETFFRIYTAADLGNGVSTGRVPTVSAPNFNRALGGVVIDIGQTDNANIVLTDLGFDWADFVHLAQTGGGIFYKPTGSTVDLSSMDAAIEALATALGTDTASVLTAISGIPKTTVSLLGSSIVNG